MPTEIYLSDDDNLGETPWLQTTLSFTKKSDSQKNSSRRVVTDSLAPFVCIILLLIFSIILFVSGVFLPDEVSRIKKEDIKRDLIMDSFESKAYKRWRSNAQKDSVPMYFNFYPFNITNIEQVLQGEKPKLQQLGPYVFRKYQIHFNVSFPDDGDCYRYQEYTYFLPQNSTYDKFWTVNIPYVIVQQRLNRQWWEELAFDLITSAAESDLFIELTIDQLAFGYEDNLLKEISKLSPQSVPFTFFPGLQPNQTSQQQAAAQYGFNEKKSGKSDFDQIGQYTMWRGNSSLDVWGTPLANTINGTEGYQFRDQLKKGDIVEAFVSTTVRNLKAQARETVSIQGIDLLRFRITPQDLMNATQYPANGGYYQYGPSGVINRTSTAFGAPLFLSLPHYLHADPWYRDQVIGMHPNESLHGTNLDVEPETGTTMNAQERLQVVIVIEPDLLRYPNVSQTYVPLVWIEQTSTITPHLAHQFKKKIDTANDLSLAAQAIGFGLGSLILCCSISWILYILLKAQLSSQGLLVGEQDSDENEE